MKINKENMPKWRQFPNGLNAEQGIYFICNLAYSLSYDKIIILYYDPDRDYETEEYYDYIPVTLNHKHDLLNELQGKDTLEIKEIKLYKDDSLLIGIKHREVYSEVWTIL